jgi:hypothetical protein
MCYGLTKMIFTGQADQEYCGLIAYPDMKALTDLSRDPEFRRIVPLRDAATDNYVMTAIEDFETLNHAVDYLEQRSGQAAPTK